MSNIKLMLKIDGLKKAIEIVKSTIDVEAFCNHQNTTREYFTAETITKTVTAIQKEIDRLENIEEEKKWDMFPNYETSEERKERIKEARASIQRVDSQIKR